MNIQLNKIGKKIVTTLFKKSKKDPFSQDPAADWEKILITLSALLFVVVAFSVFFFYKLNAGEFFKGEAVETPSQQLFDKNNMNKQNEYYDARAERFNALQASSSPIIDPSL